MPQEENFEMKCDQCNKPIIGSLLFVQSLCPSCKAEKIEERGRNLRLLLQIEKETQFFE